MEGDGVDIVLIAISHVPPNTADYRTNWPAISLVIKRIASYGTVALRTGVLAPPTSQPSPSLHPPITRYGANGGAFSRFWPSTMRHTLELGRLNWTVFALPPQK